MSTRKLHGISQTIHLDHLHPTAQLFLHSAITDGAADGTTAWDVRIYALIDGRVRIWAARVAWGKVSAHDSALAQAITGGMLHVDLRGRNKLDAESGIEVHMLDASGQTLHKVALAPDDEADAGVGLLGACFELVARPLVGVGKSDKSELRNLHAQVSKKDEEISHLQTKLASLKATVVRATASDNNKKKVQASPKKPANASALQPNAKRRKAVEDEFAGSDSD